MTQSRFARVCPLIGLFTRSNNLGLSVPVESQRSPDQCAGLSLIPVGNRPVYIPVRRAGAPCRGHAVREFPVLRCERFNTA